MGWFRRKPKPAASTGQQRSGYWCTTQHYAPSSNMKSAGVHYHPGTMPAGSEPQEPKR